MNKSLIYVVLISSFSAIGYAQSTSANSGTVRGSVADPSGAAIAGATVQMQNPVSHYNQSVQTDATGKFEFDNVPYNNYHSSALMTGFETAEKAEAALTALREHCRMVKVLGRYRAA